MLVIPLLTAVPLNFHLLGGKVSKLLELSQELKELMSAQEEYKLPLSTVISEYQLFLGKKAPFDPVAYGFNSVVDLLGAFPSIVEVSKTM